MLTVGRGSSENSMGHRESSRFGERLWLLVQLAVGMGMCGASTAHAM